MSKVFTVKAATSHNGRIVSRADGHLRESLEYVLKSVAKRLDSDPEFAKELFDRVESFGYGNGTVITIEIGTVG